MSALRRCVPIETRLLPASDGQLANLCGLTETKFQLKTQLNRSYELIPESS